MKALTVKQPWPWAMFYADPLKDIENRAWYTGFRGPLAIHASKDVDPAEYLAAHRFIRKNVIPSLPLLPVRDIPGGVIVGVVEVTGCVSRSDSPWFVGDYGLVLANPVPLTDPIFARGALGLWDILAAIERLIKEQLRVTAGVSL